MSYPPQPPQGPDHRYTAPGWPPPPPAKKRRPMRWIFAAFGVVAALCVAVGIVAALSGGGGGTENTAGPGAQGAATEKATSGKTIVMEVTASKSKAADVTYGLNADQSQDQGVKLPWKKELSSGEVVTIAVLLAQNKGSGEISCKISVDGEVVKENKSSGQYAIVTCQADDLGF